MVCEKGKVIVMLKSSFQEGESLKESDLLKAFGK
jgi:hypothetical protein